MEATGRRGGYRPWAELLKRTFEIDVLACPTCQGRMRLLAMVTDPSCARSSARPELSTQGRNASQEPVAPSHARRSVLPVGDARRSDCTPKQESDHGGKERLGTRQQQA